MPSLEKKESVEFSWNEEFERKLLVLLIDYRTSEKSPGDPTSRLRFEKQLARQCMVQLRAIMDTQAPSLEADSDLTTQLERLRSKTEASIQRERERLGDVDFARLYPTQ